MKINGIVSQLKLHSSQHCLKAHQFGLFYIWKVQKDQQNLRYLPPNSESSLSSMLISRLRVKGIAKLKQIECTMMQLKYLHIFKRMNRIDLSEHNAIRRHGRYLPNGGRCMAIGCITGIGLIWGIIWGTIWGTTWGSVGGKLVFY